MNLRIYSKNPLPTVHSNQHDPQFYIEKNVDENSTFLRARTGLDFDYTPGSFMGCNCGLINGEYFRTDPEDFSRRKRDVTLLRAFFEKHLAENEIELINLEYETLPDDPFDFPKKVLAISAIDPEKFDFEENVRLILKR